MNHKAAWQLLHSTLVNSPALIKKVSGVFDVVPEDAPSPYIHLGQLQTLEGRLLDDSERKWYVDVHIWSDYQGRKEVLEIADILCGALPVEWFAEDLTIMRDFSTQETAVRSPSGWFHGVLTIKGYGR